MVLTNIKLISSSHLPFSNLNVLPVIWGGKISSQAFIQSSFEYNVVVFIQSYFEYNVVTLALVLGFALHS